MNPILDCKDDLYLLETEQNGYGDNVISHAEKIKGLFVQGTSATNGGFVENIGTDAHAYLDVENEYVLANAFRLEGMYLVADIFSGVEDEAWYKISRCKVGQRKLLTNEVNNIHVWLTKCEALGDFEV